MFGNPQPFPFFPIPAVGETVYSVLCRCVVRSGLPSTGILSAFSGQRYRSSFESPLPGYLGMMATMLPSGHPWRDVHVIINDHTTLNYYLFFDSATERTLLINKYSSEGPSHSIQMALGLARYRCSAFIRHPQYCVECVHDDTEKLGFAYFHREHQLPGVAVCWLHGTPLMNGCNICGPYPIPAQSFSMPGRCLCSAGATPLPAYPHIPEQAEPIFWLARESSFMVNAVGTQCEQVRAALRDQVLARGFGQGNLLIPDKLSDAIEARFGRNLLGWLNLPVRINGCSAPWVRRILNESQGETRSPVTPLLLIIGAIFDSVASFEHAASGSLISQRYGLRQETLHGHAAEGSGLSEAYKESTKLRTRDQNRNRLSKYLARTPNATRSKVQNEMPGCYDYLIKHDKAWFYEQIPGKKKAEAYSRNSRIDWSNLDSKKAGEITQVFDKMFASGSKPVHATTTTVLNRVGLLQRYRRTPNNFPLVAKILQLRAESRQDFIGRRLNWAVRLMATDEVPISINKLRRIAALPAQTVRDNKQVIIDIALQLNATIHSKSLID